jgi:hypothetical protein
MDDRQHALRRQLRQLHLEQIEHRREEIAALGRAIDSLQHSHEVIGKTLRRKEGKP